MRRTVPVFVLLWCAGFAQARGLLIPEDRSVPPLAMVHHKATIKIDDQVAVTRVEQVFRNHTNRQLEATYVFPVPKGASVNRFTMWVGDKEVKGELVEADRAKQIYNSIVRQTQDPGLLEYVGTNLLKMSVFPILPNKDQKVTLTFTSVAAREGGMVEYVYPLKSDAKAVQTLEGLSVSAEITSQHGIENVYSPTHPITLARQNDKQVTVHFTSKQGMLDRDFQLFYQLGARDVGMTALTYRPVASEDGHFLMLISPQLKMAKENQAPRDLVLVLDTSGSMAGEKMLQAKKALKYFLDRLNPKDRFGLMNFATTVTRYRDKLAECTPEEIGRAKRWVDELEAAGATAISDALSSALEMRTSDEDRTFTIAFFTDGCPTVGERNPDRIIQQTLAKNTANTRIFTFGVGDDVNATLLDRLATETRAWATYVRPAEDIELKVSNLYTKIAHPVLTNLKLETTSDDVRLKEIYPPHLPDLFSGSQLIVLGRYSGKGATAIRLTGKVGKEQKEFAHDLTFPEQTPEEKQFVEHLWARRKVGYLLNEIRTKGQEKELVDEVVKLAKRHGIATPYTSYLIVPDGTPAPTPKAAPTGGLPDVRFGGQGGQTGQSGQTGFSGQFGQPGGFGGGSGKGPSGRGVPSGGRPTYAPPPTTSPPTGPGAPSGYYPQGQFGLFGQFGVQGGFAGQFGQVGGMPAPPKGTSGSSVTQSGTPGKQPPAKEEPPANAKVIDFVRAVRQAGFDGTDLALPQGAGKAEQEEALRKLLLYTQAREALLRSDKGAVQTGQLGVDLSIEVDKLRNQGGLGVATKKKIGTHDFALVGGVWIDAAFKEKTEAVVVKAQSDAWFRILERHAEVKEVFQLGNHVVWMTPSGKALVIDAGDGKEKLEDAEIDALFTAKK
jgi:Ca-activated chloride channel family protein